jgi:uncharacterized protein (TIGR03084 family)
MALDYPVLLADLRQETATLTDTLGELATGQWDLPTPAVGWSVKDQVSHLAYFDDATLLALNRPEEFHPEADRLMAGGMDFPDRIAAECRILAPDTVRAWFTDSRDQLLTALGADEPKRRLPWFGPDMSVASCTTARLMETWAHGHDVYDTVGVPHPINSGLRSIAHLGVSTFDFSFTLNGVDVPADPVRVELRSPAGDLWTWGPVDAANRVGGTALDFVLTVTQRRRWTDTALTVAGPVASAWLDIAQAYAGAPGRAAEAARATTSNIADKVVL